MSHRPKVTVYPNGRQQFKGERGDFIAASVRVDGANRRLYLLCDLGDTHHPWYLRYPTHRNYPAVWEESVGADPGFLADSFISNACCTVRRHAALTAVRALLAVHALMPAVPRKAGQV
jgi:hypothetical protein